MSENTATMLIRILSNPAWKLLLVMGMLAFIAFFFYKGKEKSDPDRYQCIVTVFIYCFGSNKQRCGKFDNAPGGN